MFDSLPIIDNLPSRVADANAGRPYFHLFGELFLEETQIEAGCVSRYFFSSCGMKSGWLVGGLNMHHLL